MEEGAGIRLNACNEVPMNQFIDNYIRAPIEVIFAGKGGVHKKRESLKRNLPLPTVLGAFLDFR